MRCCDRSVLECQEILWLLQESGKAMSLPKTCSHAFWSVGKRKLLFGCCLPARKNFQSQVHLLKDRLISFIHYLNTKYNDHLKTNRGPIINCVFIMNGASFFINAQNMNLFSFCRVSRPKVWCSWSRTGETKLARKWRRSVTGNHSSILYPVFVLLTTETNLIYILLVFVVAAASCE